MKTEYKGSQMQTEIFRSSVTKKVAPKVVTPAAAVQSGSTKPHTSITWEKVTVDLAMKYLESSNRRIRQNHVNYLASQMKAGLWRETHQGIAFHRNGELVDGHHRLWAMVECNIELYFWLTRGMTDEDVLAIDKGQGRDFEDDSHYQNWGVQDYGAGIARTLVLGPAMRVRIPTDVLFKWYDFYRESIEFGLLLRLTSRPTAGKSFPIPVAAAIARAHASGIDQAVLQRFAEILKTGQLSFEADRAAFTFRDAWLQSRLGTNQLEQYYKAEGAIRAFVERRGIRTLQRPETELFKIKPLPESLRYQLVSSGNSTRSGKSARARVAGKKKEKQ